MRSDARGRSRTQVVGSALRYPELGGSPACFSRVEEAAATLRHLVTSTAPYGKHRAIPPALRPCGRLSGDMDLTAYEAELFGNFQGTVQYNEEVPGAPSVAELCRLMAARERSALEAFADVAALFHNQSNTDCVASSYKVNREEGAGAPPNAAMPLCKSALTRGTLHGSSSQP